MIYGSNLFLGKKKKAVILMTITPDGLQNYFCYTGSHNNATLIAQWISDIRHDPDHCSFNAVCFSWFLGAGLSVLEANGKQKHVTDLAEQYSYRKGPSV